MPHEPIRPFHFWCQKVLPLVFDDSLSYYEVLGKMRDYLNKVIEELDENGKDISDIRGDFDSLKGYVDNFFDNLNLDSEISSKLDDMVTSGEMDTLIAPIVAQYSNPVFVSSVSEMLPTNYAYADSNNHFIYLYNATQQNYVSSGKIFGGVVSSIDDMTNHEFYYALNTDGKVYEYNYQQANFIQTQYTFGGYRNGTNNMRPVGVIYVLTTNNHIYTWGGEHFADTGVVYGASGTEFMFRKTLESTDNIQTLTQKGWYLYTGETVQGKPPLAVANKALVVVYGNNSTTVKQWFGNNGEYYMYENSWSGLPLIVSGDNICMVIP